MREIVGTTPGELADALNQMEDSLKVGGKALAKIYSTNALSASQLTEVQDEMINLGFHLDGPITQTLGEVNKVEMRLIKGSPQWAVLLSLPVIMTVLIGGLLVFGIMNIETITKAILPITLILVGGLIAGLALMRKPAAVAAELAAKKYIK